MDEERFILTEKGMRYAEDVLRTNLDAMLFYLYLGRRLHKDNGRFLEFVLFTIFKLYGMDAEKARELARAFVENRVRW